jgi:hypothetical protein
MGLVELFVLLAAVSGSVWIAGMAVWLWQRVKRLEEVHLGRVETPKGLAPRFEDIRGAVDASGREIERLNERVEFLERLLEAGAGPSGDRQIGSGERSTASEEGGGSSRADEPNGV